MTAHPSSTNYFLPKVITMRASVFFSRMVLGAFVLMGGSVAWGCTSTVQEPDEGLDNSAASEDTKNTQEAVEPSQHWASLEHIKSLRFGGEGADTLWSTARDPSGNIVVTGALGAFADLGDGKGTQDGERNAFVAKFDSDGHLMWTWHFVGNGEADGTAVAVDGDGNVLVTGGFRGKLDAGGVLIHNVNDAGVFLAKLDPKGTLVWCKSFEGSGEALGGAIAADLAGNIWVGGDFAGTLNLGGEILHSAGETDGFVGSFDAQGNHVWSRRLGGKELDSVVSLNASKSDRLLVGGRFGEGDGTQGKGAPKAIAAELDGSGNTLWSVRLNSGSDAWSNAIARGQSGVVAITGGSAGRMQLGTDEITSEAGAFVLVVDPTGKRLWTKASTGTGFDEGTAITIDTDESVVVSGRYDSKTVDLGGGAMSNAGGWDIFVAKYDSRGGHVWSQALGGQSDDQARGVFVDHKGRIGVAGFFAQTLSVGEGSLVSAGAFDGFLTWLKPR